MSRSCADCGAPIKVRPGVAESTPCVCCRCALLRLTDAGREACPACDTVHAALRCPARD